MSTKLSKGIRGIVKGYLQICRRAELSEAFAKLRKMITVESAHCTPRIVEGKLACGSRKGGIVIAVL